MQIRLEEAGKVLEHSLALEKEMKEEIATLNKKTAEDAKKFKELRETIVSMEKEYQALQRKLNASIEASQGWEHKVGLLEEEVRSLSEARNELEAFAKENNELQQQLERMQESLLDA